jgi:hypothetical protein
MADAGAFAMQDQPADVLPNLYCANSQYYPQHPAMLLLFYFSLPASADSNWPVFAELS